MYDFIKKILDKNRAFLFSFVWFYKLIYFTTLKLELLSFAGQRLFLPVDIKGTVSNCHKPDGWI